VRHRAPGGWFAFALAALFFSTSSCQTPPQPVALPTRHSIRSDQLLVQSDFQLPRDHPLIRDLEQLRDDVAGTLDLPVQKHQVVVYLFKDEETYRKYINEAFPGLPDRRAYFVGTSHDLAVYTYWGDRIQEDLRHEYTHGLLHASLKYVPLWLDEGLAEYFEVVTNEPQRVNHDYARRLAEMSETGWQPEIERLERIEKFSDMRLPEYQEAWAWVHFMLHSTPTARQALVSYLADLRDDKSPALISLRLKQSSPEFNAQFVAHLAMLEKSGIRVEARPDFDRAQFRLGAHEKSPNSR
jgi:hypothetical protein